MSKARDILEAVDSLLEAIKQPKDVLSIWDNGGKTVDRYTIMLDPKAGWSKGDHLGLGNVNQSGTSAGFSQFGNGAQEGSHLGKKLKWNDLPPGVQKHIVGRLSEE